MIYYDEKTKQVEPNVRVHNFSKQRPKEVRIIGSINLNPEDKNYPDKKWVLISDLYDKVEFTTEFIHHQTI